jgi:hypothetical protein
MKPRARSDELIVSEVEDEVLVYDLKRDRAHCLNRTSAFVWRHCDGEATVAELTALLRRELEAPVDERAVWLALDQLGRANLLRERLASPAHATDISRRAFVRKAGVSLVGGAILLPAVTSIRAPVAAQAGTPITPAQCASRTRQGQGGCGGEPCTTPPNTTCKNEAQAGGQGCECR